MTAGRATRWDASGSATLDLVILTPALLILIGLVIGAGRITVAGGAVQEAATMAARQASLARSPTMAQTAASAMARDSLQQQGITCTQLTVTVDVTGFAVNVGNPAQVSATVGCAVPLAALGVPFLPGSKDMTAHASSVLDTWRAR